MIVAQMAINYVQKPKIRCRTSRYFWPMHIGQQIKARAKELRIGSTELARLINTSKQNIYGIYLRESIDTDLLMKLSKALKFNFFSFYNNSQNAMIADEPEAPYAIRPMHSETEWLQRELSVMHEKYKLLCALYETKTGEKVPGTEE
jgi:hypothetical protein